MDRYAILTGRQPQKVVSIDKVAEVEAFGFEKKIGIQERYRARSHFIDRGALVFADLNAMFIAVQAHFKDRFFLCKGSQGSRCCEELGHCRARVGAIFCRYRTNELGIPMPPFSYDLFPWVFGGITYEKLRLCNVYFPLNMHDIKISCSNEEYQNVNILPCHESLWTARADIRSNILNEFIPMWKWRISALSRLVNF
jgi:hypothetical protein